MAKQLKDKYIGARVGDAKRSEIEAYIEKSDDLDIGELIRRGVDEYMRNHPIKDPETKTDVTKLTKPGV